MIRKLIEDVARVERDLLVIKQDMVQIREDLAKFIRLLKSQERESLEREEGGRGL